MSAYLERYRAALQKLPDGVTSAEVNAEGVESVFLSVRNGEIEATEASNKMVLFLRASGDKTGYAYSEDLDSDPAGLILEAVTNAQAVETAGVDLLNPPGDAQPGEAEDDSLPSPSIDELKEAAVQLEQAARRYDRRIKGLGKCEIRMDTHRSHVLNSLGLDVSSQNRVFRICLTALAEKDGSLYDYEAAQTAHSLRALDLQRTAGTAARMALLKGGEGRISSGVYDVLISPRMGYNILITTWQAFSGIHMHSGATFLSRKLGEQIGSRALNIIDTPAHPKCGYRFAFDSEGTPGKETAMVTEGVYTSPMHNLATASRAGVVSTGNAGRVATLAGHIPTQLIVIPTNFAIAPGEKSAEDLVRQLENGIYLTYSEDMFHTVNVSSGDFSIPCGGVRVRNGEICESLLQLTLTGNLLDLFRNIEAAGSDLWFDEFFRRSYCLGSPSILVRGMQVNSE